MLSEIVLARELFVALLARIDGVARVVRHVHLQLMVEGETLLAFRTRVLLVAVLLHKMRPAKARKKTRPLSNEKLPAFIKAKKL